MEFRALLVVGSIATASSVPVQGDIAILQCPNTLPGVYALGVYALRSSNGTFAWTYNGDSEYSCGGGGVTWNSSTVLTTCRNGSKMVVDALRSTDGRRMWRSKIKEQVAVCPNPCFQDQESVLLDMASSKVFTVDVRNEVLSATELPSSKTIWQHNFSMQVSPLLSETVCMRWSEWPGPWSCLESVRVLLARTGSPGASNQSLILLDATNGTLYWSMDLLQTNLTDGTIAGKPVVNPNGTYIALAMQDKCCRPGVPYGGVTLYTIDLRVSLWRTAEPSQVRSWRLPTGATSWSSGATLSGDGNTILVHSPPYLTAVDASLDPGDGYIWSRHTDYGGMPIADAAGQKAFALDYTMTPQHEPDISWYTVYVFDIDSGNFAAGGTFEALGDRPVLSSVSADGTTVYASFWCDPGISTCHSAMNTSSRQQLWNHTCHRPSMPIQKFV